MLDQIPIRLTHLRWVLDRGDQTHRLDYPLTKDSVVIDCGGYKGEWSEKIADRFHSKIYIFEPVDEYYRQIVRKFKNNHTVKVYPFGLGERNTTLKIARLDDASSMYLQAPLMEEVSLKKAASVFRDLGLGKIDLIKINIEGGEYDLLEHLIKEKLVKQITNIQVQFHRFIPDAAARQQRIHSQLSKTHRLTYNYPFIWENWTSNAKS